MNAAYPLLPIGILVIASYALSFVLSQLGIISRTGHRKFWNVLLLLTFLVTGLIGLLLVVKINYKLTIPYYDQLMTYHVDFGIAMAIIGFFHFIWHLKYYLRLFSRQPDKKGMQKEALFVNDTSPVLLKISAFLLGSTTMIAQVILLREFLTVFNGNELTIGIVLANWMVLTAAGAWLGSRQQNIKKSSRLVFPSLLLLSALPFVIVFLINFLKNIVFPVGMMISVFQLFFSSFLLLLPFCLISGFLFTLLSKCYSESSAENRTGTVYGFESTGSVIGGLLTGVVFIFVFSSVESLLVLAILNSLVLLISEKRKGKIALFILIPALILLFFNPEIRIRSLVYPNQQLVVSKDSPFGNLVVSKRGKQISTYCNNNLLFDSENFMTNEELVHFAMLQHPDPKKVLLISGDPMGQIAEVKKYNPEAIHYLEENRWMLQLLKDSLEKIRSRQVKIFHSDPMRYLRKTREQYDVIIMDLPAPSTLQTNRYYTGEFFRLAKKKLSADGVLSFGLSGSANYQSNEAVDLYSTLVASLKTSFRNVIILPGEKNYFLASDAKLTYRIAEAVQTRGIENQYVNPFYIEDDLLKSRGETILSALNPDAEINRNLKPLAYRQQLKYWLSYFPAKYGLTGFMILILALFLFFRGSKASKTMFVTGFSASGLEILLLFGLQVFFGNIYLLTSFVFAGFMTGLAAGSFYGKKKSTSAEKQLPRNQFLIAVFSAVPCLLFYLSEQTGLTAGFLYPLYFMLVVLLGGLTGFQFSLASWLQKGNFAEVSGKTYSYDLYGSALGAFAVSLFLVPRWGIIPSVLAIGILNLLFGFWLILKK